MKNKTIELLINFFCRKHNYNIIEVRDKESEESIWGVSKNENNTLDTLVFSDFRSIDIIDKNYKMDFNERIIKILFIEETDNFIEYISEHKDQSFIIISSVNNKIIYYSSDIEYVTKEIASMLFENIQRNSSEHVYLAWVTYIIIGINIMVYLITAFASKNVININWEVLQYFGAKDNILIYEGEYYRLFTCMFLHGGIVHLLLNMYALYCLGPMVERLYGRIKYFIIYLVSGIVSSIFSLMFSNGMSVGASGAIFGLLSAVLVFTFYMKNTASRELMRNIFSVIIINLFIGLTLPNIDNYGHLGGLIGGVICSFALKNGLDNK